MGLGVVELRAMNGWYDSFLGTGGSKEDGLRFLYGHDFVLNGGLVMGCVASWPRFLCKLRV